MARQSAARLAPGSRRGIPGGHHKAVAGLFLLFCIAVVCWKGYQTCRYIHSARVAAHTADSLLSVAGGQVITPYSGGELVKNKTLNVWRSHDALDIGGGQDAPVLAVGDGVIAAISNDPLWGGMIQLEHPDGHVTVYSGVRVDPALKTGGKVKAGDTLGTLDQIPAEISLDPHIHLEMSKNGVSVDPTQLLQQ